MALKAFSVPKLRHTVILKDSYEQTAAKGLFWTSSANIAGKALSVLSQIVLGWILSKEEFGQYAIAIGLAAIFMALRYGGAPDVLVQKSYDYARYTAPVRKISAGFNLAIAVSISASAGFLAELYSIAVLKNLLYVFAFCQILNIPVATAWPTVLVHSRFKEAATIRFRSMVIRHLGIIIFALSGFGVYSFVLPVLLLTFYESIAFTRLARSCASPLGIESASASVKSVLVQCRWVLLASVSVAAMNYGTSIVLSYFETLASVAVFYFGFQIFANVFSLVDGNLRAVLLTLLSHISNDVARQRAAFFRASRIIALSLSCVGVLMALICPPVTNWVFSGKWDGAILVVQIFMFTLPFMGVSSAAYHLLSAQGRWRDRSLLLLFEAILLVTMVGVGSHIGTIVTATAAIFATRAIYAITLTAVVSPQSARIAQVIATLKYIMVPAIPGALLVYGCSLYGSFDSFLTYAAALSAYTVVLVLLFFTIFRTEGNEFGQLAMRMYSR